MLTKLSPALLTVPCPVSPSQTSRGTDECHRGGRRCRLQSGETTHSATIWLTSPERTLGHTDVQPTMVMKGTSVVRWNLSYDVRHIIHIFLLQHLHVFSIFFCHDVNKVSMYNIIEAKIETHLLYPRQSNI